MNSRTTQKTQLKLKKIKPRDFFTRGGGPRKNVFFVIFQTSLRGVFKQVGGTIFKNFILVGIVNFHSTQKQLQKLLNIKPRDLNGKKGGCPKSLHLPVAAIYLVV